MKDELRRAIGVYFLLAGEAFEDDAQELWERFREFSEDTQEAAREAYHNWLQEQPMSDLSYPPEMGCI